MGSKRSLTSQYASANPLQIQIRTHALFEEVHIDLNQRATDIMNLVGQESILDVGCGHGAFLQKLASGHTGRLVGLDQSAAMIAEAQQISSRTSSSCVIEWTVGEAEALPFQEKSFDWVSARHMLYHVEEKPQALNEFQRVVKPTGFVLLSTNSRYSLDRINNVFNEVLLSLGLPERKVPSLSFCTENAEEILSEIFPRVVEVRLENALVFHETMPIVQYMSSMFPFLGIPAESELWTELESFLMKVCEMEMKRLGGIWRDPKIVSFFVCS